MLLILFIYSLRSNYGHTDVTIRQTRRQNIIKYSKIKILNFIKLFLPNYYLPHDIIFMKKLPKEVSGKISKKKLLNTI